MHRSILRCLVALAQLLLICFGQEAPLKSNKEPNLLASVTKETLTRKLVWSENFDTLDLERWKLEHSTFGDGNNELQCYTPEQVSVKDGKLTLTAEKRTVICPNGDKRRVTSGMVRSKNWSFTPGQSIEWRVKLSPQDPAHQASLWPGFWSSAWAGPWLKGGEWDGLEVMTAKNPKRAHFSVHYLKPNNKKGVLSKPFF